MTDDFDPPAHERVHVTHKTSGDLGWLVRRDGVQMVRLDRGPVEELREYRPEQWAEKADVRPMSVASMVQVAFRADQQFLKAMGKHDPKLHKDWLDLPDEKRKAWLTVGPTKDPNRRALYQAIIGALQHLAG